MLSDFLKANLKSNASYVEYGFGQVEPNHLSAQRTSQVYAQLPANKDIKMLEQGQFVKYDYANGEVNYSGKGEWMLVYNEIKLYREHQMDCEFAMIKDNYQARLYSPFDPESVTANKQSRYYNGVDASGADHIEVGDKTYYYDDVTAENDIYELHYNNNPFATVESSYKAKRMPDGTTMVPRVFKTNVGDIFTTNTINGTPETVTVGKTLTPGANGILEVTEAEEGMLWQVVKVYTMPDGQRGVKIMRIQ